MRTPWRHSARQALKVLVSGMVLYLLAIPVLYWLYRYDRGLDWWAVLGGDPRVPPELHGVLIRSGHEAAPEFNLWSASAAAALGGAGVVLRAGAVVAVATAPLALALWLAARRGTRTLYPREHDLRLDDVRGRSELVEPVNELLATLHAPAALRAAGGEPPRGVLVEGPPGSGKTLLARAIAGTARVPLVWAPARTLGGPLTGVRASLLFRRARRLARRYGAAVLLVDGLDAARTATGELLAQLDGLALPSGPGRHLRRLARLGRSPTADGVLVIGTATDAATVDPALLTPGRLGRRLHLGALSGAARDEVLRHQLRKLPHEQVDTEPLARDTHGSTPAQLAALVNEGLMLALADGRDRVSSADLRRARAAELRGRQAPVPASARDRHLTAFHEAGHAVLGYVLALDERLQMVSIERRHDGLGAVHRAPAGERHNQLREELRRDVVVSLGGIAAEELWFGETTAGGAADLRRATRQAAVMLGLLGMGDSLVSYGALDGGADPLAAVLSDPANRRAAGDLLLACKQEAQALLRRHQAAVKALAERLLERGELAGEEVEELLRAKAVARATPAFRPVLEVLGDGWHPPALVDGSWHQREPAPLEPPAPDRSAPPRELDW